MTMKATVGTTTYGFRYLLMDPSRAPSIASLLQQTRDAGLAALQICENARPLEMSATEWRAVLRVAADVDVAVFLGCMTLDIETLSRCLERAAMIPGARTLRIVLEDDSGQAPARDCLERFLEAAAVRVETAHFTLVVENHFHIPCRALVEMAAPYPAEVIAFCIDSANSLRNWESASQVFDLLDPRAVFYHLKDYRVRGSNVGFEVSGAPLGEGDLDLGDCLDRMFRRHPEPLIFLENWVAPKGDWQADVAADSRWLRRSLKGLALVLDSKTGLDPLRGSGRQADAKEPDDADR